MQFTVGLLKVIDERLGRRTGTFVLIVVVAAIVVSSLWIVLILGSTAIKTISSALVPILTGSSRTIPIVDVFVGLSLVATLVLFFSLLRSVIGALRSLGGIAEDQNEVMKEMHKIVTALNERIRRLEQGADIPEL